MADPELDLRKGGGGGLNYLPWWPFSVLPFLLFYQKGRGGGGVSPGLSPRSATDDPAQSFVLHSYTMHELRNQHVSIC